MSVVDELVAAWRQKGWSQHEWSRRTDNRVSQAHICRLIDGTRTQITVQTAELLAEALGLELRPTRKRRR